MTRRIRVLVVDNHTLVRQGITTVLRAADDIDVVGEASGGAEAVQRTGELKPDVVLMDVVMPDVDGIEATQRIREAYPSVYVIALSSFGYIGKVHDILRAGAVSYLLKDVSPQQLLQIIRDVAHKHLTDKAPEVDTHETELVLSQRERDVMVGLVEGKSNAEIAEGLSVSGDTVKTHLRNLYRKLGVNNRDEAVTTAIQRGLIT